MPLYEYQCPQHGTFDTFLPVAKASAPQACPDCGGAAERVYSVPRVSSVPSSRMAAMARNEKSQHQPHVCSSGCHHHAPASRSAKKPGGMKAYTGPRPWVIEHA